MGGFGNTLTDVVVWFTTVGLIGYVVLHSHVFASALTDIVGYVTRGIGAFSA